MPRNASFDYLRFVAAIGIVLFHAGAPGSGIGYAALPFFLITLVLMAAPAAQTLPFARYTDARVTRLMAPCLIWSAVYGTLKIIEVWLTSATWSDEFTPAMLLTGPALHLWFLPYACLACVVVWPALRIGTPACVMAVLWSGLALFMGWYQGLGQLALALALVIGARQIVLPPTWASRMGAQTALGIYLAHPLCLAVSERLGLSTHGTLWHAVVGVTAALGVVLILPVLHKQVRRLPIVASTFANRPTWVNTKA